jgi:hypothetical protein
MWRLTSRPKTASGNVDLSLILIQFIHIYMKQLNVLKFVAIVFLWLFVSISCQCPSGTTGYNCQSCPDGCDNCDTSPSSCDACSTGYYIDASNVCNECPNNCLACDTPFVCTKCKPGYDTMTDSNGYQAC